MNKKLIKYFHTYTFIYSIIGFFFVLSLVSCQKNANSYDVRLDNFKSLLNEAMIENFEIGRLDEVSQFLTEESEEDEVFQKELLKIKTFENIEFFNNEQVVSYFYNYFYKQKQL